jgi:hypothetical protein
MCTLYELTGLNSIETEEDFAHAIDKLAIHIEANTILTQLGQAEYVVSLDPITDAMRDYYRNLFARGMKVHEE